MRELKAGRLAGVGLAIGATLLLVLVTGTGLPGPERSAAAGPTTFRALLVSGKAAATKPDSYFTENDNIKDLTDALLGGAGNPVDGGKEWKANNIVPVPQASKKQITDAVAPIKTAATVDDVTLIVLNAHGSKIKDGEDRDEYAIDGDTPVPATKKNGVKTCSDAPATQCDERLTLSDGRILDDALPSLFAGIKGTKVYIIDSCYAGGMSIDGFKDLPQDPNAVLLFSSRQNERSWSDADSFGHPHSYFTGLIIAGLTDDETNPTRFARADANQNGEVTVSELYGWVQPRVDPLARSVPPTQYPDGTEIHQNPDEFRLSTFGNTAIFRYKDAGKATSTVKKHSIPAAVANVKGAGCEDCPDGGDCPVGGIAEPVALGSDTSAASSSGSGPAAGGVGAIAGSAAAAAALAVAGGWYAWWRLGRRRIDRS